MKFNKGDIVKFKDNLDFLVYGSVSNESKGIVSTIWTHTNKIILVDFLEQRALACSVFDLDYVDKTKIIYNMIKKKIGEEE
ncbi:MAG: hypothetical protein PF569_09220 [Candidatus Woesearchaeota archaeon]|jgi:hypothetical protein|nr:hypothetical protein [Candidatus Woesearchaeota archaeon]